MKFEDLKRLYLRKRKQFGSKAYKHTSELLKEAKEIHRILKPGKVMAWLIGDHWRKKSGFIPVGFKIYRRLLVYFKSVDLICVTRRNQSSNTPFWHERARRYNFYLRGFKHLFIMRKPKRK